MVPTLDLRLRGGRGRNRARSRALLHVAPRIGGRSRLQDAEFDELRTEFVADVHDARGRFFEVEPHLLDGVAGPAAHARGGVLVIGARFFASGSGSSAAAPARSGRTGGDPILRFVRQVGDHAFLEEDRRDQPRFAVLPRAWPFSLENG